MSLKLLPLRDKLWAQIKDSPFIGPEYDLQDSEAILQYFCESLDVPEEVDVQIMPTPVAAIMWTKTGQLLPFDAPTDLDGEIQSYYYQGQRMERIMRGNVLSYALAASTRRLLVPNEITSPINLARSLAAEVHKELTADLETMKTKTNFGRMAYCPFWPPLLSSTKTKELSGDRWWLLRASKFAWFVDMTGGPLPCETEAVFFERQGDLFVKKVQRVRTQSQGSEVLSTREAGRYRTAGPGETSTVSMLLPEDFSTVALIPV